MSSFTEVPEAEIVGVWRGLVEALAGERYARGWGLRRLAIEAGVSFSVVSDIEAGNAWPRLGTAEAIASALGFILEIEDEPGRPAVEGVMCQVRQHRRSEGVSPRQLAEFAGVRPNTLYELPRAVAGGSVRTLLVLTHQLDTRLLLAPIH